jgi:Cu/Zn superoxide dismutase
MSGLHGFHVHENANISPDCGAAGGHFKSDPNQIHGFQDASLPNRFAK